MHHSSTVERRHSETPARLSQEQLNWITEQNKRAAQVATRRTIRRAVLGYVILLIGVFGMYQNGQQVGKAEREAIVTSGRVVSVDGCNRDFKSKQDIIALLDRLRDSNNEAYKDKRIDAETHDRAIAYYTSEIERATKELPDCRKAEKVVTADPDELRRRHVVPLHTQDG